MPWPGAGHGGLWLVSLALFQPHSANFVVYGRKSYGNGDWHGECYIWQQGGYLTNLVQPASFDVYDPSFVTPYPKVCFPLIRGTHAYAF